MKQFTITHKVSLMNENYNCHAIYTIKSILTDRIYVGSAVNFIKRKKQHLYDLKFKKHCNIKLQNHYNKYCENDLIIDIIEVVSDKNDLIKREQYYIDFLKPHFNICKVAGSSLGRKKPIEKIIAEQNFKNECSAIILKNKPITDFIDSIIP